jgi:hypothetical protein
VAIFKKNFKAKKKSDKKEKKFVINVIHFWEFMILLFGNSKNIVSLC